MDWISSIKNTFDLWQKTKTTWGFDQIFLSAQSKKMRGLNVFERHIDSLEISDQMVVGVLVSKGTYWGASVCDGFSEANLNLALESALVASRFADAEPDFSLAPVHQQEGLKNFDAATTCLSMKQLESLALEIEERAYGYSPKIYNVPHAACGYESVETLVLNSNGVCVNEGHSLFKASLSCAAKGRDGRIVNVGEMVPCQRYGDFNIETLLDWVSGETIRRLDPSKITSGSYPVIFDANMAAFLLGQFVSVFSGEMIYKQMSKLQGRRGQKIASSIVTLKDCSQDGLIPHVYDAEGQPCLDLFLIKQGVFESALHNRLTAAKLKEAVHGRAGGGLGSLPGVSPTNLSWDGVLSSEGSLLSQVSKGIYVTEMAGASVSAVSGDFSYGAQGYLIENGKIGGPLADFTVAGNFFDFLQHIKGVGHRIQFVSPGNHGSLGGRMLLVESLEVAG